MVLVLICAGCATQPQSSQRQSSQPQSSQRQSSQPQVNLSGYSPAFRQGYSDGCASVRASLRRDEQRYRSDSDYMIGWNDGHSVCQRRR